jgi:hypothetical protein
MNHASNGPDRVRHVAPILLLRTSIPALANAVDAERVGALRGLLRSLYAADVELTTGSELLNDHTNS